MDATPESDLLERTTLNPADWMQLARKLERATAGLPEAVRLLDLWRDYDCCFVAGTPPSREQESELRRQTDAFLEQTKVKVWREARKR